jgi:hypothetical protein
LKLLDLALSLFQYRGRAYYVVAAKKEEDENDGSRSLQYHHQLQPSLKGWYSRYFSINFEFNKIFQLGSTYNALNSGGSMADDDELLVNSSAFSPTTSAAYLQETNLCLQVALVRRFFE